MTTIGELTGLRPRRRGHDGKHAFKSAGAAEAAIRALARRGERATGQALREGESLAPYTCDVDGARHWHIGNGHGRPAHLRG